MDVVRPTVSRIQPRFEPRVWLSLEGVDPEQVTARLGIANDGMPPPEVMEMLKREGTSFSSWAIETHRHIRTNKLSDHLDWIVNRLSDKLGEFRGIAAGAEEAMLRVNGPVRKWDFDRSTIDAVRERLGVGVTFMMTSVMGSPPIISADDLAYRPALADDANSIAALLDQLGYPAPASDIPRRLESLAKYPNTLTLVAADGADVVGIITAHVFPSLHETEPVAWITSMVVSSEHRMLGIGSELVERAEQWAMEKGAVKISLTSALHREGAHAFYEQKQRYEKTGLRFSKLLGEEP